MTAKPPSDQESLHYQWYLAECATSEQLRVEITVLKRNQKPKGTKDNPSKGAIAAAIIVFSLFAVAAGVLLGYGIGSLFFGTI